MNDLPPGWTTARLEDVAEVILGQSPPGRSYNTLGQGLPFFQGKAEFGKLHPAIRKWTTEPKKLAVRGDILLSVRAPVGPTNIAPTTCAVGRGLHAIRPVDDMDRDFVLWGLRSSVDRLIRSSTGSTFTAVTGDQVRTHEIQIPPVSEQNRIVEQMNRLFARLDAIETTLKPLINRLRVLRSAILADAFYVGRDLPPHWESRTVGEVAEVQLGRQRSPKHHTGKQMRPYLRAANVTWNGISLDDVKEMNFDDSDLKQYRLEPGDLLLNEASGTPSEVGKPVIWDGEIKDCCFQNTLLRLRPRGLDMGYLYWYCYFSALAGRFGDAGRGVNIRHLGKRGLSRFPISVAPRSEQSRIAGDISNKFDQIRTLQQSVEEAQNRAATLRRSVLAEAFAGRLVAQDPDDEPASVLLERIAASRPAKPKRRRSARA